MMRETPSNVRKKSGGEKGKEGLNSFRLDNTGRFREFGTALVEASLKPSWEGRKEVLDSLSEETFTAAPL